MALTPESEIEIERIVGRRKEALAKTFMEMGHTGQVY
jgi:hypothetical protein